MANEEHVKRLKQGVAKWNAWRRRAKTSTPDLICADLLGTYLRGADLSDAHLVGADLSRADLSEADLSHSILTDADLSGAQFRSANLRGANLINADLRYADLAGADLSDTILRNANLTLAVLHGADLTRAELHETFFTTVDLSNIIGLDTCDHRGPSIIDHSTFQMSEPLPLTFLRGVGLPDRLIEYLPSLTDEAIQFYSCFISYSAKDEAFANRIHADLQNQGVRCWFAPHDMPIGGKILDEIDVAIRLRDKVLLILSKNSIRSEWVEDEVTKAFEEERKRGQIVLFPVRLDDAVMDTNEAWAAKLRAQRHIGDFRHWKDYDGYQRSFSRVMRDLRQLPEPKR